MSVREALVMDLLRLDRLSEASCGHSETCALGASRTDGTMHVPAVRTTAEELDPELATEVKRNGTK